MGAKQRSDNIFKYAPKIKCTDGSNCTMDGNVKPKQKNGGQSYTDIHQSSTNIGLSFLQNLAIYNPGKIDHLNPKVAAVLLI